MALERPRVAASVVALYVLLTRLPVAVAAAAIGLPGVIALRSIRVTGFRESGRSDERHDRGGSDHLCC